MEEFKIITQDYVNVQITTSKDDIPLNEKRFQKGIKIMELKNKLELLTGASPLTMELEIYDKDNKLVCVLSNNDALFGSYPVDDGMRLHIIDKFSLRNEIEVESVEKYEMPLDEYAKKSDTVRAYLIRNKLGKYQDDELKKQKEINENDKDESLLESILVGSRCQVSLPGTAKRLGSVRYVGSVEGLQGYWVGVQYDEPLGKNDGSFKGNRYFTCSPNYGGFVKPQFIVCGDFPEETYDLDEEI